MESINVVVDDNVNNLNVVNTDGDDNVPQIVDARPNITDIRSDIELEEENGQESSKEVVPSIRIQKIHPKENISGNLMISQIYVDDIVFGGMSDHMVEHFVQHMKFEFEMSLVGELNYFLGLQVKQMEDSMFISKSKYAKELVKKFGLEGSTHKKTHAATHIKLTKHDSGPDVDQSLYRSMIGSLLYLTASRPDIAFAVGVCARYQAAPKESHLAQVKRIIKYVSGTGDYGIFYAHHTNSSLVGYCDGDWPGNADDRKSTSGRCFFLGNNLILWFSKKQNCVSLTTAEAEYIAVGNGCTQLLWMKQMLKEYNVL
ncbi:uncharacterized mitochondrial protein AtMg00810-like [Lotus japonicus]|uniref:uncharacterized mitochondrial protein AtMg00810-like n=1 Tax=Lotus japonicus TaxID=34305 RepID=UPI00258E9D83|nr:uncharacterized mitochondrial protein AtMg00810-like [Lotus japonicus]